MARIIAGRDNEERNYYAILTDKVADAEKGEVCGFLLDEEAQVVGLMCAGSSDDEIRITQEAVDMTHGVINAVEFYVMQNSQRFPADPSFLSVNFDMPRIPQDVLCLMKEAGCPMSEDIGPMLSKVEKLGIGFSTDTPVNTGLVFDTGYLMSITDSPAASAASHNAEIRRLQSHLEPSMSSTLN